MGPVAAKRKSISFSGAGFLTSYHLGVVHCLRKHGIVGKNDIHWQQAASSKIASSTSSPMILSGVSGGALAATSIVLDIRTEDAMSITMKIARLASADGGMLNALHPRYELSVNGSLA